MSLPAEAVSETGHAEWWRALVACPGCGIPAPAKGPCPGCGLEPTPTPFGIAWEPGSSPAPASAPSRRLLKTVRYYLSPWSNPASPLKLLTRHRLKGYYERTLGDRALGEEWFDHYLAGLGLSAGDAVLDHGCGRGRNIGLMQQMGLRVAAQDIAPHPWWSQLPDAGFQALPPSHVRLPWRDDAFSLVADFMVIGHLAGRALASHAAEVFRILKPGGAWVILEANSLGLGARGPRRHYGRLHPLDDVGRVTGDVGFAQIDHWFEGFYSPVAPILINYLRKQCSFGRFDLSDHRSWIAGSLPARWRAHWVFRLRKPELA